MSKGKLLAICIVWLMIVGVAALSWRFLIQPTINTIAEQEREETINETSGDSKYKHTVDIALDPFSGYAVIRSEHFRKELAKHAIRARLTDDGADYAKRLQSLQDGSADMATFTIDALIKASQQSGNLPAVIVAIIDETRGADAMVAAESRFPNVNALNTQDTRFVLTPDSPSETLTRVVMSNFDLNQLSDNPFVMAAGPEEIVKRYRESTSSSNEVYVLWEPFVSEILSDDSMHVIQDSSAFRGYIVDVLVTNRDFLRRNPDVVQQVLSSYLLSTYHHQRDMEGLVISDSKQLKAPLSSSQASNLVRGISWKNTMENFAHFGLLDDNVGRQHIEDMIVNITSVLLETGAITSDPTEGNAAKLFNQRLLAELKGEGFHPNLESESLAAVQTVLPSLSDDEWSRLRPKGDLRVPSLVFPPGSSQLTNFSKATLKRLVRTLKTWPQYYLLVRGNAATRGNLEANRRTARQRAEAAAKYLVELGVHPSRLHAVGADPSGGKTVSFVLGEPSR